MSALETSNHLKFLSMTFSLPLVLPNIKLCYGANVTVLWDTVMLKQTDDSQAILPRHDDGGSKHL
jgi:hypothetical protein